MSIRLNLKNCSFCLFTCCFIYLAYLIWTAKEKLPQFEVELKDIISYVVLAVEMGGHAVARIFADEHSNIQIRDKGQMDVGRAELLTKADLVSNHLMLALLRRFPLLRVISEEKQENLSEQEVEKYRADNYELWLGLREALSKFRSWRIPLSRVNIWVDPLDATQEFTEGLTQFVTVMACVTIDGKPIFGAIHKPFSNETVFGMVDHGLFDSNGAPIEIPISQNDNLSTNKTIVISRSHMGQVTDFISRAFGNEYLVEPVGGAGYKALRLIRQTADLYIHTTAIKKWDLCASDALIRAVGGALLSLDSGLPLDYSTNKRPEPNNPENNDATHSGGMLMALRSPYSIYERLKPILP